MRMHGCAGLIILPVAEPLALRCWDFASSLPPLDSLPSLLSMCFACNSGWLQGPTVGPAAGDLWGG